MIYTEVKVKLEEAIPWEDLIGESSGQDDEYTFEAQQLQGEIEVGATVTVEYPLQEHYSDGVDAQFDEWIQGKKGVILEIHQPTWEELF